MSKRLPKYRRHKPSGQAVVTLGGHDYYLGKRQTLESKREYDRLIAEWLANGRQLPARKGDATGLSLNEVILAYWQHAETYYRHPDGTLTSEADNIRLALRPLKRLDGHTSATDFDSLALEALREEMIREGHCRNRVNKDVSRVKRLFRWAAGAAEMRIPSGEQGHFGPRETTRGLRFHDESCTVTFDSRPFSIDPVPYRLLKALHGAGPGQIVNGRTLLGRTKLEGKHLPRGWNKLPAELRALDLCPLR